MRQRPVASASIAQVHLGILKDGREVAVKVLRPGVEREIAKDLALLQTAASLVERVRNAAAELYDSLKSNGGDFWKLIYEPFMERDLNREQVKSIIKTGLADCAGNYRRLLEAFRLPSTDYQRFMDFLRHHNLKP